MGLNNSQKPAIFLNVKGGKLAQKSNTGEGTKFEYVDTETNEVKETWYNTFDSLDCVFEGIRFNNGSKFGEQLMVFAKDIDSDEKYIITMNTDSDYACDFMKRLPSVSKGQMITIRPVESDSEKLDEKGQPFKNRFMAIKDLETEEKIKSIYSEENPLPQWETKTVNRKKVLDKENYLNALIEGVKELVIEKEVQA